MMKQKILKQKGFIPLPEDVHRFKIDSSEYILDRNSLYAFKGNSMFSVLLPFSNDLSPDQIIQKLSTRFSKSVSKTIVHKFQDLQKKNLLVSYKEVPVVEYQNGRYKLSLGICDRCNMSCHYCYSHIENKVENINSNMSESTAKKAIDFLINDFGANALDYEINLVGGGEPLLNFKLIKKLKKYCHDYENKIGKKIYFWIFTNGTVFTDEMISYFIKEKQGLTISLDGPEEVHDCLRVFQNGNGSYSTIKNWIIKIKEAAKGQGGIENLWISSVITNRHCNLKDVLSELVEFGISNALMRPIRSNMKEYALRKENLEKIKESYLDLVNFIIKKTLENDFRYIKIILTQRDFLGRFILKLMLHMQTPFRCDAAKSQICILSNGDIYPCDISCGIDLLKIGNLFQEFVIDTAKQKKFFDQCVTGKEPCKKCWAYLLCGGGCYYSAFLKNKSIGKPDPVLCELTRFLIELSVHYLITIQESDESLAKALYRYVNLKNKVIDKN